MEILYLDHLFLTFMKCANPETGGKYLQFKCMLQSQRLSLCTPIQQQLNSCSPNFPNTLGWSQPTQG